MFEPTNVNSLLILDAYTQMAQVANSREHCELIANNIHDCIVAEALEISFPSYKLEYGERVIINDALKYPSHYDCVNNIIINLGTKNKAFMASICPIANETQCTHFTDQVARLYENIIETLIVKVNFYKDNLV